MCIGSLDILVVLTFILVMHSWINSITIYSRFFKGDNFYKSLLLIFIKVGLFTIANCVKREIQVYLWLKDHS